MPISSTDALSEQYDVCVVGAGPAGIACALRAYDRGLRVLVLEAGGKTPVPGDPDVLAAEISHPQFHDSTDIAAASALGGSSHWWGGRCAPFDIADFRFWPIDYAAMTPWWAAAAEFLGSKPLVESSPPGAFAQLAAFNARRDETWGPELNMARRWNARLKSSNGPTIVLNARVTGLALDERAISHVNVRVGAQSYAVNARHVVLTCGGLGSLRLLLMTQRANPWLCGGAEGPLGRGYMGHLTGVITDLEPSDAADAQAFVARPVGDDVFGRRRIIPSTETVTRENIANIAFWLESASSQDPRHGSAVGSAKYLAAHLAKALLGRGGGDSDALKAHIANVTREPISAISGLTHAMYLLAAARVTGRHPRGTALLPSSPGRYQLFYHAEQAPDARNRIGLSAHTDSIGLPKLKIDFAMREHDFASIVRAHDLLDADLRTAGAGQLHFRAPPEERIALVEESSRDGYHQMGGAVISADPAVGVVDTDLRVHGLSNLWVASGCVFPSGGQANPTMTIVALSLRLAEHLAGQSDAPTTRAAEMAT
ncbi:MAG: GMC oxidoreductase [Pseudomonadota bacterium]